MSGSYRFGGTVADTPVAGTPVEDIPSIFSQLRKCFASGKTLDLKFRRAQLRALYNLLCENEDALVSAVRAHMQRPKFEVLSSEVSGCKSEIAHMLNHLEEYSAPQKVGSSALFATDSGVLRNTPRGVVLVMGAWNFPIGLLIKPLAGAIAAGCAVLIRPNEIASEVAELLAKLIPQYLDSSAYRVVFGGVSVNTTLLKLPFNLVFFTGSAFVGRIVATAMAKHLCPVVLELGGKNPVVVDCDSCDLRTAARRIAWGRFAMNCGQICLAPEFVLIASHRQQEFIDHIEDAVRDFFGDDASQSADYGRIVSAKHFERVSQLLAASRHKIAVGGKSDARTRFVQPTVVSDAQFSDTIMQDEVFAPILCIVPVKCRNETDKMEFRNACIDMISQRPKPLALYVFSGDSAFVEAIVQRVDAGGVTVNDVLMHYAFKGFPFGGTGLSGMGTYHGKHSFDAFSRSKPVLYKYAGAEWLNTVRCPPFADWKYSVFSHLSEETIHGPLSKFLPQIGSALVFGGIAYVLQSKL